MRKRRFKLVNNIQLIFVLSMLFLSGFFLLFQINSHNHKFEKQAEVIQTRYTAEQKAIVKREVERVVDLIRSRMNSVESSIEKVVKVKVYEAYAIAENIYNENKDIRSESEIQKMITDALRPIRFENNQGYFFISTYTGQQVMLADRPEMEGLNHLNLQDESGKYIYREIIDLIKESGEGLYPYLWTKPELEGNAHKKISFVKGFEPYEWIIGTGLYVQDIENQIKKDLLEDISNIRFGQEGYIFVNTLDAYALVSNGQLIKDDLKLWEVFNKNPEKTKALFKQEYDAALEVDGDYIFYSIQKLSDSTSESPKTSFIYGLQEINWLIGAGVYLDDVEENILELQDISLAELKIEIGRTIFITAFLIAISLGLFLFIGRQLKKDFLLFTTFFDKAVFQDVEIELDRVKFQELINMADSANKMQYDKVEAQHNLLEEKEKLRISENNFRLLAEYSKDMIFKMSLPDGNYEYISPASIDVIGYTPLEITEEPFHIRQSIHPDWHDWLEKKLSGILNGIVDDTFEYQMIHKSGNVLWITQKNTLIKNEAGEVIALVGRLSNDTERKRIEEKLNHSYRMEAIGRLAGGVAHDFNNVLAGIINAAQVLKSPKRDIDDKGKQMVELIMKAAIRAADLTAKLSTFSRKRALMLKSQDLHHIIDETITLLNPTIDKKITLVKELNADSHYVKGDGTELQSALMNLGINATHSMTDGGEILFKTSNIYLDKQYCDASVFDISEGNFLLVEVIDCGSGIQPGDLKRIFEPFFSTKEQGKGTGLGLATVYGALQNHRGAITVVSDVGIGTTFKLYLPCSKEIPENSKHKEDVLMGSGRILLVDDEEIIRFTGKNILEDMGYSVIVAENGRKAVELYQALHNEIDLVIMDVIMPEMNGPEAFLLMKKIKNNSRIILTSGFTRDEDIEKLKKQGLSGFIKKPFRDSDLYNIIEKILNE